MSVDILGTNCDQCLSMVQCCFTSTETVRLIRTESPGRPPRLSQSSWTLAHCVRICSKLNSCDKSRISSTFELPAVCAALAFICFDTASSAGHKTRIIQLDITSSLRTICHTSVSSVQFSSRWYLCARKSPYALHHVSQKFPQRCLWNSSNFRLTDDGPLFLLTVVNFAKKKRRQYC